MNEKITGYVLLVSGILVMTFSVVQVFLVFTNKIKPVEVFHLSSSDTNSLLPHNSESLGLPKIDLISPSTINEALNFSTHFFLMSFLLGFGYRIASLGVMFLRPVVVKMKTKEGSPPTATA